MDLAEGWEIQWRPLHVRPLGSWRASALRAEYCQRPCACEALSANQKRCPTNAHSEVVLQKCKIIKRKITKYKITKHKIKKFNYKMQHYKTQNIKLQNEIFYKS